MARFRKKQNSIPELNTASLPDLIFTVLFFFMIVTHIRTEEVKVQLTVPEGRELTKIGGNKMTPQIYIGTDLATGETKIQLDDKFVTPEEITKTFRDLRRHLSPEDKKNMVVTIKADRHAKMSVVNEVKQALRKANALKVVYASQQTEE